MKHILVALVLISTHVVTRHTVQHDCKRVYVYAADYYCGYDHDFQLQGINSV